MTKGIDAAAQGMMSITTQIDINANNLANINTAGFKQSIAVFKNTYDASVNKIKTNDGYKQYGDKIGTLSIGSNLDASVIDLSQGNIKQTGNDFNLAISGKGLFALKMQDGSEAYTRNGNFIKNKEGFLSDINGNVLIGEKGPLSFGDNNNDQIEVKKFKVDERGDVFYNNKRVDSLKIVEFNNVNDIQQNGNSLFISKPNTSPPTAARNYAITQGAVEGSNASAIECMINTMQGERTYESLSKVIQTSDKTLSKAINEVGRVKR